MSVYIFQQWCQVGWVFVNHGNGLSKSISNCCFFNLILNGIVCERASRLLASGGCLRQPVSFRLEITSLFSV